MILWVVVVGLVGYVGGWWLCLVWVVWIGVFELVLCILWMVTASGFVVDLV